MSNSNTKKSKGDFAFLGDFIAIFWEKTNAVAKKIKYFIFYLIISTGIGLLPSFFGAPLKHSFWLAFPISCWSIYKITDVRNYLYFAALGEALDIFKSAGKEKNETIWDSEVALFYRKVVSNLFLTQIALFFFVPLYINLTSGSRIWLPIFMMVAFAIAVISVGMLVFVFRGVAIISIILFLLMATYDMFPQVGYVPFISKTVAKLKAGKIAGKNAKELVDLEALLEKQRLEMEKEAIKKARLWREGNRGKELPEEIKKEIEAAREGLTLREKLEAEVKAKADADAKVKAEADAKKEAEEKTKADKTKAEREARKKAEEDAYKRGLVEALSRKEEQMVVPTTRSSAIVFSPLEAVKINEGRIVEYNLQKIPNLKTGDWLEVARDFPFESSDKAIVMASNEKLGEINGGKGVILKGTRFQAREPFVFGIYTSFGRIVTSGQLVLEKK